MVRKINNIEVTNAEKRRVPSKHYVYVINVEWSDGSTVTIFRRYSRFFDLQTRLLDHFPIEAGTVDPEMRVIPFLPGKIFFGRSQIKDVAMKRLKEINEYCKNLIKLPSHISECEIVLEFFEVEPEDLDPPVSNPDEGKQKSSKEMKGEKISKPKRMECYVAVAKYVVQEIGEMALRPGLKVEVLEKSDSGWWFVNSEDEQGWVPSTYLEREEGSDHQEKEIQVAGPGQEENYICIEYFEAASTDEISLDKGAVVQVLQKNMDGWWLVRYKGREAYAPGTYLKKAVGARTVSAVQKSKLSGVEIINSLQDVSNLLNQDSKAGKEQRPTLQSNKDSPKGSSDVTMIERASAVIKQRSLERGGSLTPPPRKNSVNKMWVPKSVNKSNVYVTAEDFTDTVGDGLSFKKGEKVEVSEKTPTGWWFVRIGGKEGWVPTSYIEPDTEHKEVGVNYDHLNDDSDDNWYAEVENTEDTAPSSKCAAKRPLPPIPTDETDFKTDKSKSAAKPLSSLHVEKTPNVALKIPLPSHKQATVSPPGSSRKSSLELQGKEQINVKESHGEGTQNLAAVLKAKFDSRSGTSRDSLNLSESGFLKDSKPMVLKPQGPPNPLIPKAKALGITANLSSDFKGSGETNAQPIPISGGTKSVPKPTPPVKLTPVKPATALKPTSVLSDTQTSKPAKIPLPPKPVSKPIPKNVAEPSDSSDRRISNVQISKWKTGEKPEPVNTKPVILQKPKTPAKSIPADQKPSQNVNSLAHSLSGKLNFGQNPSQTKSLPSEGIKNPVQMSVAGPKSSHGSTASSVSSSNYVAVFAFVAENDSELGFNEGDEVEVLEQQGDWSLIRLWDEEGWAPSNYLQKQ